MDADGAGMGTALMEGRLSVAGAWGVCGLFEWGRCGTMAGMPIRFVLGRAGTGKTQHCLESVRQWMREKGIAGRAFFLVPQQATFNMERVLACAPAPTPASQAQVDAPASLFAPPARDAGSLLNVRVVSFESLTRELAVGMEAQDLFVASRGRRMIISQVLRQHAGELRYFRSAEGQPHLAAKLDVALAEIQQEMAEVDRVDEILQASEGTSGQATADKVHDLRVIAKAYEKYLGQERLDPIKRLEKLEEQILASDLVADSLIVVDGFASFTKMQIRLLTALAKRCHRLDLCLLMDPDDPQIDAPRRALADEVDLFCRTRRVYCRLWQWFADHGVKIQSPLRLWQQHRLTSSPLKALEKNWEIDHPQPTPSIRAEVLVMEAVDLEQEVLFAARQIRKWQIQGNRLRDIGILCRSLEPYHAAIRRVFAEHDIAGFIDRRRELSSHPLVRYVRVVLGVTQRGWRQIHILELLKTGLTGLGLEETDFLENFALKHGIEGIAWVEEAPWEFTEVATEEDRYLSKEQREREVADNARADVLRRKLAMPVQKLVRTLREPRPMKEHVGDLYELLCCEEHKIRQTLAGWMKHEKAVNRPEAAQEHQQAWKEVMKLLEDAVRLLGEETLAGSQFVQTMEAGLEEIDLALTPPTLDQVTVGQIDRSRSPEFKKLIVMGLNEGVFPTVFNEDPIFSDTERRALEANDIEMAPDSSRQILGENMLGYIAMTRASETLVLSRPLMDGDGRETSASIFLDRVRRIVSPLEERRSRDGGVENITSPAQAAAALMQHLVKRVGGVEGGSGRGYDELLQWVQSQPEGSEVARPTNFAMSGLQYGNQARIERETVQKLYTTPLVTSVSRIETFAACPFKHFVQYGLKLEEREVAELSGLDLGNAFHFVLERMVRQFVMKEGSWQGVTEARIDELADEVAISLRRQLLLSNARNRYLLRLIKSTLRRVLRDQKIAEDAGAFRPLGAEVEFGPGQELGPLEIITPETGQRLLLRGKIDRVDWVEQQLCVAVYDYKTNHKRVELKRVLNGLTLQLLAYLLVLEDGGGKLTGGRPLTPAGAFYVELLRKMENVKLPGEPLEADEVEARPEGVFREDVFGMFDGQTQPGEKSKVLSATRNKTGELRKAAGWYTQEQFALLLAEVRQILGRLAEDLLSGNIAVEPYKMGTTTPCGYCEYRPVCRMDPQLNDYRPITGGARELREQLLGEKEQGQGVAL
jgi:ATP-dependent helicase/nuclease subunit B